MLHVSGGRAAIVRLVSRVLDGAHRPCRTVQGRGDAAQMPGEPTVDYKVLFYPLSD